MPSARGMRTSPVSASTRTSTNWAPNAWRANGTAARALSAVSTCTSVSPRRSPAQASMIAAPHDDVPIEPPASIAWPESLSPISTRTWSSGTSSASAAICVSTVRAPVPMSAAVIRNTYVPSPAAVACAVAAARRAG